MAILRLIRLPNLLIIALTQYLLQYVIISPAFLAAGLKTSLDDFHFFLLVLTTLTITISGYVINDIFDYQADLINKPEKVVVNKSITLKEAFGIYHLVNVAGFALALHLAFYIHNLPLVLIYPSAVGLLFLYSRFLKKQVFWGNFIVSVFCAFVAGIVLFAERKGFFELPGDAFRFVRVIFIAYFIFAFLSTFYREIIKDIEDFKGDQTFGCTTLPIRYGVQFAKSVAFVFGIALLICIIWWMLYQILIFDSMKLSLAVFALNFAPVIVSLLLLKKANSKEEFSKLSLVAKYIMISGLLYLLLII